MSYMAEFHIELRISEFRIIFGVVIQKKKKLFCVTLQIELSMSTFAP